MGAKNSEGKQTGAQECEELHGCEGFEALWVDVLWKIRISGGSRKFELRCCTVDLETVGYGVYL